MNEAKQLVTSLFKSNNIHIPASRMHLFNRFVEEEQNKAAIQLIIQHQNELMAKWKLEERIADIIQQPVRILNATVGKSYETKFDLDKFNWKDITTFDFEGLQEAGLRYDEKTKQITGMPTQSGDVKFKFKFKVDGQPEEAPYNEKLITIIINPDPNSLCNNI
jgi:hypothetical protein